MRAGVGYNDFGVAQTKEAFSVMVQCKVEQVMEAIPMVFTEVERARRYGFTQSELNRVKESLLARNEKWFAERDKRVSDYYVQNAIRHFLDEQAMMAPEVEYELTKEIVNAITLEEVNAVIPALHREDNRVVVSYAPEREGAVYPTGNDIEMLLKSIKNSRNISACKF